MAAFLVQTAKSKEEYVKCMEFEKYTLKDYEMNCIKMRIKFHQESVMKINLATVSLAIVGHTFFYFLS